MGSLIKRGRLTRSQWRRWLGRHSTSAVAYGPRVVDSDHPNSGEFGYLSDYEGTSDRCGSY